MTALVLFSGGWDSALCAVRALASERDVRFVFYDYGQSYFAEEECAVSWFADHHDVSVERAKLPQLDAVDGVFADRNELMLRDALMRTGAGTAYLGVRGLLDVFDRYKDSNLQWAWRMERKYRIQTKLPCLMLPKAVIRRRLERVGVAVDHLFTSEGL
jgi:hypothetical protein